MTLRTRNPSPTRGSRIAFIPLSSEHFSFPLSIVFRDFGPDKDVFDVGANKHFIGDISEKGWPDNPPYS